VQKTTMVSGRQCGGELISMPRSALFGSLRWLTQQSCPGDEAAVWQSVGG
jgi:hypothetical protein